MSYQGEDRGYETLCWIWTKALTPDGYGQAWRYGRVLPAHRAIYEEYHGPIGELTLHHLCGQYACVNPDHMQPLAREAHNGGEGHGKLSRDDAEAIRARLREGERPKLIASEYGISRSLVSMIGSGQRWG